MFDGPACSNAALVPSGGGWVGGGFTEVASGGCEWWWQDQN